MKSLSIYSITLLVFLMVSCQKDQQINTYDLGSEFFISSSGYTSLDNKADFFIENQQNNLSEVKITNLGGTLANDDPFSSNYTGTITIVDSVGSITLTETDLGITSVGSTADFQFDATFEGKPFSRFSSLTVKNPVSITSPTVKHRADTIYYSKFKIRPVFATVETVKVQTKVSSSGTYADVAGTFAAIDSIPVNGSDYNIGDTLFVKVTGTVGSKTASAVSQVVIESNSVSGLETFTLVVSEGMAFDFIDAKLVGIVTDSADIEITGSYTTNALIIGFASNQNAEFVLGTDTDYSNGDKLTIEGADYNTSITSNDNVSGGEVYFFRTKRGSGDYFYGIMKVTMVDKPQGVLADSYIEIEYKY